MSMPEIPDPNPDLTKEAALNMILTSIALEETALSHIINAEGKKIQYVLSRCNPCTDIEDVIAVNQSVKDLLDVVVDHQIILKRKMEKVLENLPKPPPPPRLCHPPSIPCHPQCFHFSPVPRTYTCGEEIHWQAECTAGSAPCTLANSEKIFIPSGRDIYVSFCLRLAIPADACHQIKMNLQMKNQKGVICEKTFCSTSSLSEINFSGYVCLKSPCSLPNWLTLTLCSPHEVTVKGGTLTVEVLP